MNQPFALFLYARMAFTSNWKTNIKTNSAEGLELQQDFAMAMLESLKYENTLIKVLKSISVKKAPFFSSTAILGNTFACLIVAQGL